MGFRRKKWLGYHSLREKRERNYATKFLKTIKIKEPCKKFEIKNIWPFFVR
jgi:hypothetical protein